LESATFNNKQLTKPSRKLVQNKMNYTLLKKIISELIKDKDIDKAWKESLMYIRLNVKKIQLNTASIKEVQKQHSGTVELLNEYLKDDFEDENKQ
jgi:hypothetical protein